MNKKSVSFRILMAVLVVFGSVSCNKSSIIYSGRELDPKFCSQWNPDFKFNRNRCCRKASPIAFNKAMRCNPERYFKDFCSEMTPDQIAYTKKIESGKYDVLQLIERDRHHGDQAFCTEGDGFLAYGRRIVPTPQNRLQLFFPGRCTNFGTDQMVGMLEWVGRAIAKAYSLPAYSGVHLLIGDVTAPRGGCVWGLSGYKSHLSHSNGLDADIGFLTVEKYKNSPVTLHQNFDAKLNWWVIKLFFHNPYTCVKRIFLDNKLIQKLNATVYGDPEWRKLRQFIKHVPGHHNHFHVRIGGGPGVPGCFDAPRNDIILATHTVDADNEDDSD